MIRLPFGTEPPEYEEVFRRLAALGVGDPEAVCLSRIGESGPWSEFADLGNVQALMVCRALFRERLIDEELPPAWPVAEVSELFAVNPSVLKDQI